MKKKVFAVLLAVALMCSALALVGCDTSSKEGGGKLVFDKKYISSSGINKEQYSYLLFKSNGTGECRTYIKYTDGDTYDYTIKFIYTYADSEKEGVYCFYDGITYGSEHNTTKRNQSDWHATYVVSDNVVMASNGGLYVNEDYAAKYLKNMNNKDEG